MPSMFTDTAMSEQLTTLKRKLRQAEAECAGLQRGLNACIEFLRECADAGEAVDLTELEAVVTCAIIGDVSDAEA